MIIWIDCIFCSCCISSEYSTVQLASIAEAIIIESYQEYFHFSKISRERLLYLDGRQIEKLDKQTKVINAQVNIEELKALISKMSLFK